MEPSRSTAETLWFRTYRPVQHPRLRLVCFAHAGGGPSAFVTWHEDLPADVEVVAVRYPGRQDRLVEPCAERMEILVDAVTRALGSRLDCPVALFGHSMGAWVAYEVAHAMRVRYGREPQLLVASGQVPPGRRSARRPGTDKELLAELRRLGGYHESLFEDPDLAELLLPPIRSDFELIRAYRPAPRAPLTCAVLSCFGEQDVDVPAEAVRGWEDTTTGRYLNRTFPGGHFYLEKQQRQLLGEIAARLASGTVLRR